MKRLLHHARQLNQRRMSVFYLLENNLDEEASFRRRQLELAGIPPPADRPRTAREMFAELEYDDADDELS